MRRILGISAYYHDAAAALVVEGRIAAAAQEERFSRRKNDERFPRRAAEFCLRSAGLGFADLDAVVFYDKPIPKFTRLLESFLAVAPAGMGAFLRAAPSWLGEKLNLPQTLRDEMPELSARCPILFTEHHQAHAASAFYPSPFDQAAILTIDGVGEWATTTLGQGRGASIELMRELRFPHSLGLLYSAFTAYCGFRVNSGEYKLMGLAPYGRPRFAQAIYEQLLDLKPDGSFRLNLDYFGFLRGFQMTNRAFNTLFEGPPRPPEAPIDARHADVAASVQAVTNEVVLRLARQARQLTGHTRLCMAGGVALNCVANGLLLREGLFDELWIQPAAGDAGGALGAALAAWHASGAPRPAPAHDSMQGALLGPEFSNDQIQAVLDSHHAVYTRLDPAALTARAAGLLREGAVLGWFQGRMEFGPRALGNRSILGDPRSPRMQSVMNLKVKFRESFRPFAPVVLAERAADYFELQTPSPYMLLTAPVRPALRRPVDTQAGGLERIKQVRSTLPAVTHIDYSARIQTLARGQNPRLRALLEAFHQATGCAVLVNTSFNVRGEPVVCSPDDAYRCFVNTSMDWLAIGDFLLERRAQPQSRPVPLFDAVPD